MMKQVLRLGALLLIVDLLFSAPCLAQTQMGAREAYNYVQQKRKEASKLWEQDRATSGDIEKGIQILEGALIFLDKPEITNLALDDYVKPLKARWHDVFADLATAHALLNNKEESIDYLRRMYAEGSCGGDLKWTLLGKAFNNIRQEPEFKEIVEKLMAKGNNWSNSPLKTPYRENISEDEKVAGLSIFWSEVKYNFVYFDHVPELDWDQLYLTYLPKVRYTKNTLEFYHVLEEMCAKLKDSHTNVYFPKELHQTVYSHPPMWAALIEDKVIIVDVRSDSLRNKGIEPGLEIISIDGLPVRQYAEQFVAPYLSSSTKQDLDVRTYTYSLLSGPKDKAVDLELMDDKGNISKKSIPRSGYNDVKSPAPFKFKVLDSNIGYVALRSFEDETVVKSFDKSFDAIVRTDALILDVRENGGGDSGIGWNILGYLTEKTFKTSRWRGRDYLPVWRAWEGTEFVWDGEPARERKPNGKRLYAKPVVVLTSGETFSAGEDFCVVFDYMKRGKIIGEPTAGSTGQPLSFDLPGGGSARVCVKRDSYPDGREFVGIGIKPDILARPTVADVRAGKDTVLETALDYLKKVLRQ
ncbi:MAG: S41 family peptidase [Candidatus Sumerlaeota bacterium]|nr:S41 family peptidase [Candidatus Sumerlaeota bacterium]